MTGRTGYDHDKDLHSLTIHELLLELGRTTVILASSVEAQDDPQVREVARREYQEFMSRSPEEREKGMTTNP